MINVTYTIESLSKSDIVAGTTTLKDFCSSHGLSTTRMLTVNGSVETELDLPLSHFADENNLVDIVVSTKLANA